MKIIKMIEGFICEYEVYFKTFVLLLFLAWVLNLGALTGFYFNVENPEINLEPIEIIKIKSEYSVFCYKMKEEAEKSGHYGFSEYFRDLRAMRMEEYRLWKKYSLTFLPAFGTQENLQHILLHSKNGVIAEEEMTTQSQKYADWMNAEPHIVHMNTATGLKNGEYVFSGVTFRDFCIFVLRTYLKCLLIAALIYLIKMPSSYRKGILETILADKSRFAKALLFWPKYVFNYPSNTIREIRVEAELRRVGSLFRKLTFAEKMTARQVASSDEYENWIAAYRKNNQRLFRRGLLATILPAIILYFLFPLSVGEVLADQSGISPRGDPVGIELSCSGGESVCAVQAHCPVSKDFYSKIFYQPDDFLSYFVFHVQPAEKERFARAERRGILLEGFPWDIGHVPIWLFGLFV